MSDTGSLIRLHHHENKETVLDFLSDYQGRLYYKNAPVYIQVSADKRNAIIPLTDGIFVDKSYFLTQEQYEVLTQFSFKNSNLYFGNKIISWEYTEAQLKIVNNEIWEILNKEYPQDDVVYSHIRTADDKIFMAADGLVFTGTDGD